MSSVSRNQRLHQLDRLRSVKASSRRPSEELAIVKMRNQELAVLPGTANRRVR